MIKNPPANAEDRFDPGSGRFPGEGNGNPLVFLPGKFHGERSLVGYSPWGCRESDITAQLIHKHTSSGEGEDTVQEQFGVVVKEITKHL